MNHAQLEEIVLTGRSYTWSNGADRPTLERLDRIFVTADWINRFPNHLLKPLSSDCSDHCPLLLHFGALGRNKRRFRFEAFWAKMPGFFDVVKNAWSQTPVQGDRCRALDQKFRNVAHELRKWSNAQVGSVRLQLVLACETLVELDELMETRQLDQVELELRRSLKIRILGLASLSRCMARQRAHVLFLREGDANTKFFDLQACHRSRRQRIDCLDIQGLQIVGEAEKAEACYQHFNAIMGTNFQRSRRFDLNVLGLPVEDLQEVERLFTEQEVWAAIQEMPGDRAPGPDGFTGLFYKRCWHIINDDIMHAFNAFWALDSRRFHHLNEAYMFLLRKKEQPSEISDYRPISVIHSFGKLLSKCLALRLAPWLQRLVQPNQSAFIRGRSIHDNFKSVRLNCKAIHKARMSCVLLKVDVAKAFDSVD